MSESSFVRFIKGIATRSSSAETQKQSKEEVFTGSEMEDVLKELDQSTLLRVVRRSPRLLPIALRFIQARYVDRCLELSNKMEAESIEFVKLFGMVIRSLKMVYDEEYRRFDQNIENVILDCCSKSPYELCLVNAHRFSLLDIKTPFGNVTKVVLNTGTICTMFSRIGIWFPKLRALDLIDIRLHTTPADKIFHNELCPELQDLNIRNLKSKDDSNFYMEEISVLVKNSPKITNIRIYDQENIDELLKTIAKNNSELPNVCLDLNCSKPIGASAIHFKSLKCLNLNRCDKPFNISTDQIERIHISCESFDESWMKLFKNNKKNAREIFVEGKWSNDKIASEFVEFLKELPNLRKIDMWASITTSQVVDFVSKSGSFENGKFKVSDIQNNKIMTDSLQPEWECSCYSDDIFRIEKSYKEVKIELNSISDSENSNSN